MDIEIKNFDSIKDIYGSDEIILEETDIDKINNSEKMENQDGYYIDIGFGFEEDLVKVDFYEDNNKNVYYFVQEPALNDKEEEFLKNIKNDVELRLVNHRDLTEINNLPPDEKKKEKQEMVKEETDNIINEYYNLTKTINNILNKTDSLIDQLDLENLDQLDLEEYKKDLPGEEFRKKMKYYLIRDIVYEGKITPIRKDLKVEDITFKAKKPVIVNHKKFSNECYTNIYHNIYEFKKLQDKYSTITGENINKYNSNLEGVLEDGSRVTMELQGSSKNRDFGDSDPTNKSGMITIRQFATIPFTPSDLIRKKTLSSEIGSYLWLQGERGSSMILVGNTGSGKTTMLNSLTLFFKPMSNIHVIEDTSEIKLYKDNVNGVVTNEKNDLSTLVSQGLRKNPENLIVGEARDPETIRRTISQAGQTGHNFYTTIHGDSMNNLLSRLRESEVQEQDMTSIDNVLFMKNLKETKNRRVLNRISEIYGIDEGGKIKYREVSKFERKEGFDNNIMNRSLLKDEEEDIRKAFQKTIEQNLEERKIILEYLSEMFKRLTIKDELNEKFMKDKYKFENDIYKTYMNDDEGRKNIVIQAIKENELTEISNIDINKSYQELKELEEKPDLEKYINKPEKLEKL